MNYKKIYDSIIERAKNNIEHIGYFEKHHIIPRCIGGSDDNDNLVYLTAREHYVCHWLLAKHKNISSLWLAFSMMTVGSNNHDRIKNSRMFERSRIYRSIAMSGDGNPMYGKKSPASQETRDKISIANSGRVAYNKGIKMPKFECIHCGKLSDISNLKRWHNDNCKHK